MKKLLLLPLLAAACGCSSAFDQIFLRPVGDPIYANTYYPELAFRLPSEWPRAAGLAGARGYVIDGGAPCYQIVVKVTVANPSTERIVLRCNQQFIRFGGYPETQRAVRLECDGRAWDHVVVSPFTEYELYFIFRIEKAVVATPAPFKCILTYAVADRTFFQEIDFIEITPGELEVRPPWSTRTASIF